MRQLFDAGTLKAAGSDDVSRFSTTSALEGSQIAGGRQPVVRRVGRHRARRLLGFGIETTFEAAAREILHHDEGLTGDLAVIRELDDMPVSQVVERTNPRSNRSRNSGPSNAAPDAAPGSTDRWRLSVPPGVSSRWLLMRSERSSEHRLGVWLGLRVGCRRNT